jgi:DNA-binding LacI/PurR family transcriptional regulator
MNKTRFFSSEKCRKTLEALSDFFFVVVFLRQADFTKKFLCFFAECLRGVTSHCQVQGCQMVYFQTKNPNLGKYWRALQ